MNAKDSDVVLNDAEADLKVEKIGLDKILVQELGQFGKFQLRTLLLASVIIIFSSWGATEYMFTTARISTRCVIPECDGDQPEWSPYWLANAVPATGSSTFNNCQRFGNTSVLSRIVDSQTCPSTLFDRNSLQPCEQYVYENTYSCAYDFGLACDEWRRSLIGTIRTLGTFTALPITGYVSDRWGRRVALVLNAFNTAWLGIVRYWSNNYIGFMISEFIEATFGSGGFSSIYILLMELVGPKYRVTTGAIMNTFFAIGQVLMGLIAWAVPNWRDLTLALYIPQLLTLSYFWLITESVRWYMSKGMFEESEALLKNVARINGKQLSEKSLGELRLISEETRNKALKAKENNDEPWLIVEVFRHKKVLLRCAISPIWWITTTFIYYGLSLNAVNMSGNRYLNFIAVMAVEIPGYWISMFLMGIVGRKPVMIGAFWLCAACQIAYVFLPTDLYAASLSVYLIAKCAIAMVVTTLYVYTSELYPTKHRHSLFAFSSMTGRIGSMLAPLTPAIGAQWFEELPFILFASLAILAGAVIFLMPETHGVNLPDTMEQAEQMGLKANKINTLQDYFDFYLYCVYV